jgi:Uma2 family endonuclease
MRRLRSRIVIIPDVFLPPSESVASLEAKFDDYRTAGTRLAWIVDPIKRTVTIRDLAGDFAEQVLTEGETIDAAPVLPGLSMSIARIFDGLSR